MATSLRADGKQVNQQSLSHDENWDMGGSEVKNPSANAGDARDASLIPGFI